jgi:DNA polymerase type B, organellar and viral
LRRNFAFRAPLVRYKPKKAKARPNFIAYDFETTNITNGKDNQPLTPEFRYLTMFSDNVKASVSIEGDEQAIGAIKRYFLREELDGAVFVAWNGNRFDGWLIISLLCRTPSFLRRYRIRPFVAKQAGMRGFQITDDENHRWNFYDGIAMLGLIGVSLAEFTKKFAPDHAKLSGTIDWETEEFDSTNEQHVRYAEVDSEGLYFGIVRADEIIFALTGFHLGCTIGGVAVRNLIANLPDDVLIWRPRGNHWLALQNFARRGGLCFARRYKGPLWQYDMNQCYASQMRTMELPCGNVRYVYSYEPGYVGEYVCSIRRTLPSAIPFLCCPFDGDFSRKSASVQCFGERARTIICSSEIETLTRWGWEIQVECGWVYDSSFNLKEMVDDLEARRMACESPNDAIGTCIKALGNHAFGKTGEQPPKGQYVVSEDSPSEDAILAGEDSDLLWWMPAEDMDNEKLYHRPQLAAHITAGARMALYNEGMKRGDTFVKCDTDSIACCAPVHDLEFDKARYGAWKTEYNGVDSVVLGKKVNAVYPAWYYDAKKRKFVTPKAKIVAKGMRIKELGGNQLRDWFDSGEPPLQTQVQVTNWKGATSGRPMFKIQDKHGTDFRKLKVHTLAEAS